VVKCEVRCEVGCDWSVASGSPRTLPDGDSREEACSTTDNRRPLGCPASPSLLSIYIACLIRPTHLYSPVAGRKNTTNVKHYRGVRFLYSLIVLSA